jgi:hypothetical protein
MQYSTTLRGARRLTYADAHMRDLLLALLQLAVVTAKLCGSGGVRAVMAENLLLKQQLIVLRRARKRAPNLAPSDRLLCGFWSMFLSPGRLRKVAVPSVPRRSWRFIKHWSVASTAGFFIDAAPQEVRTEGTEYSAHSGHRRTQIA